MSSNFRWQYLDKKFSKNFILTLIVAPALIQYFAGENTAKNIVISPDFLVWKFWERHSFRIVSGESSETMWKLCLSTKFPHHEIKWNYGIFRSVSSIDKNHVTLLSSLLVCHLPCPVKTYILVKCDKFRIDGIISPSLWQTNSNRLIYKYQPENIYFQLI